MPASPSMPSGPNRRRHKRVVYRDPVQVTIVGSLDQHVHALLAEDVSESGLALNSAAFFAIGSRLLLELEAPDDPAPIRLLGRIVWTAQRGFEDHYRLGVEFQEVSDEAREQLRLLVRSRAMTGANPVDAYGR